MGVITLEVETVRVYHPEFPEDSSRSIIINKSEYDEAEGRYKIAKEPKKKADAKDPKDAAR